MICIPLIPFFLALIVPPAAAGESGTLAIENGLVRVLLVREHGAYREEWFAGSPCHWRLVAASGNGSRTGLALGTPEGMISVPLTSAKLVREGNDGSLELRGSAGSVQFSETIRLSPGSRFAHVSVTMKTSAEMRLSALLSTYAFAPDRKNYSEYGPVDFVYTPGLRPGRD
ncbi:MAG TPA: hypothetical protein VMM80_12020, partial [Bacteroidota bacterium]|nr:hypothetical protein [Bacteroidota bacterium]